MVPDLPVGEDFAGALHRAIGDTALDDVLTRTFTANGEVFTVVSRKVEARADGELRLWSSGTGELCGTLTGHQGRVSSVAVAQDGRSAVSAGWDGSVRLWDLASGTELTRHNDRYAWYASARFQPHGGMVACCGYVGDIDFYDAGTLQRVGTVRLPAVLTGAMTFSRRGHIVFAAGYAGGVQAYHLRSGRQLRPLPGDGAAVSGLAVSATGGMLAASRDDGSVTVWELARGELVPQAIRHDGPVTGCAFGADGGTLVTTSRDGTVRRWDLKMKRVSVVWSGDSPVLGLAELPPNRVVVSTGEGQLVVVDPAGEAQSIVITGPPGHVETVACSPNGQVIVAGSVNEPPTGGMPVTDGVGRPASLVEGLVFRGRRVGYLPDAAIWDRVHTACLQAFAITTADRAEPRVHRSAPIARAVSRTGTGS
jgi:WD40 repeat protein